MRLIRQLLREPLFAFILAGIGLFLLYEHAAPAAGGPVVVDRATRAELARRYEAMTGRAPNATQRQRLEYDHLSDELLYRASLDAGAHLRDPGVRQRLIDAERLRITESLSEPNPEAVVEHYAENLARYSLEPAASLEQVYFATMPADPAELLRRLRRGEALSGEDFAPGRRFPRYGRSMLEGIFGAALVDTVWSLPIGEWQGPIASPRGWHFVRVEERVPAIRLPFADARPQVEADLQSRAIDAAVAERVGELRRRYGVRIED